METMQVGQVCVVLEGDYLFGVYINETTARLAYSETDGEPHPYVVFLNVPVFAKK
jgi:hypothetical protein